MSHIPAERCLSIIELLADGAREMPLGDIAERLELPKSGTHRLLATLVERGWAEQDPDTGFYRLTMRLAVHGQRFYMASGVPDVCQPLLDRFARDCGEFARLAVVDGNALTWIASAQGATSGLVYQPSDTSGNVPLFATATGKAWLATMSADEAVEQVVRRGGFNDADRYGPNAIRSIDALLRELKTTAARGYGVAVNEAEPGVTAIAAVIRAGVTTSAPASSVTGTTAAGSSATASSATASSATARRAPTGESLQAATTPDARAVGTVSIAGPSARLDDARIRILSIRVIRCAHDLSSVWPVRRRAAIPAAVKTPASRQARRGSAPPARPR